MLGMLEATTEQIPIPALLQADLLPQLYVNTQLDVVRHTLHTPLTVVCIQGATSYQQEYEPTVLLIPNKVKCMLGYAGRRSVDSRWRGAVILCLAFGALVILQ